LTPISNQHNLAYQQIAGICYTASSMLTVVADTDGTVNPISGTLANIADKLFGRVTCYLHRAGFVEPAPYTTSFNDRLIAGPPHLQYELGDRTLLRTA